MGPVISGHLVVGMKSMATKFVLLIRSSTLVHVAVRLVIIYEVILNFKKRQNISSICRRKSCGVRNCLELSRQRWIDLLKNCLRIESNEEFLKSAMHSLQ